MSHKITFLRHGLSIANADNVLQGQHNFPLAEEGRLQAEKLAKRWLSQQRKFDLIISSPLLRASETARIIADALDTDVEFDEIWMERQFGAAEGSDYEVVRTWYQDRPLPSAYEPFFESGESDWDLFRRAGQAVQELIRRPAGSYLVVSHGGILGATLRAILGLAPRGGRVRPTHITFDNTGHTVMQYEDQTARWSIVHHNLTCHLDDHLEQP
jgi:broad specificity phosphatase PhoE